MKKYLLLLAIFLSSLFFIGNTKAETTPVATYLSKNFYNYYDSSTFVYNEATILSKIEALKSKLTSSSYDQEAYNHFLLVGSYSTTVSYSTIELYLFNDEEVKNNKVYFSLNISARPISMTFTDSVRGYLTRSYDISSMTSYSISSGGSKTLFDYSTTDDNFYLSNFDLTTQDGTILFPKNSDLIKTDVEPSYNYEITNPTNSTWQINFNFENMSDKYYYKIYDTSNNEVLFTTESTTTNWQYEIFYNKILRINLYDQENNYINGEEIDITGIYWQEIYDYSVLIEHDPKHDNGNSYKYSYISSNKNETWEDIKCFHGDITGQISGWYEDDCSSKELSIQSTSNNILQWKIVKNDEIIFQRQFTVINDLISPYIIFSSKELNDGYNIKISAKNILEDQYITYRINESTVDTPIENNGSIYLNYNARIYAYIWGSNNTVIASAYTDVVVNVDNLVPTTSITNINNIMKYFKNISNPSEELIKQFSSFWNTLKTSNLYTPLIISFIGTIILCVISIIKR